MLQLVRVLAMVVALQAMPVTAQVPLRAFAQLPNVEQVTLSPDGTKYAAIIGDESSRQVQIRVTGTNAILAISNAGPIKIRQLQWVGSGYLLTTSSTTATVPGLVATRNEWVGGQLYDLGADRLSRSARPRAGRQVGDDQHPR